MLAYATGPPKVRVETGWGLEGEMSLGRGVSKEGSPREALEEMLGKPWGRCLGELLRNPLRQEVPRKVKMWVAGRWTGLMLSLPHPQRMTKSTSTCLAGADPLVRDTFDF